MLLSADLRSELFKLGAGRWPNITMFSVAAFGYGLFANRLIDRFATKRSPATSQESVEVPT